jgi:quinol monooxygenase YgiN
MAGGAWAQENLAQEYRFKPKPGMGTAVATALRAHAEWRVQNGDPWSWRTYEVATGEDMGSIIVRSRGHTWADFDAYDASFALKGGTHFAATVGPLLESTSSSIAIADTINIRWPEDESGYTLYQTVTYHLIPGRVQTFTEALNKFHNAIVQQDYPGYYAAVSPVVGGAGPTTTFVFPVRNWSEFEDPDQPLAAMMAEVYGEEETAAIYSEFASCYTAFESSVLRLRPDLSVIQNPEM